MDWSLSNKIQTEVISFEILVKIFKFLAPLVPVNAFALLLNPWLFDNLPLAVYSGPLNFWFVYVFEVIYFVYITVLYVSFDVLFVSICIYLVNQIRHLCCFFENISYANKDEIREAIDRHVFICR